MAVLGLRFCARAFSSCGKRGPLFIAVRGPLTVAASPVAEHRLQTRRLSSCGSRAQLFCSMWDLPRPGLEPVTPALAGRFSTTAPPGKPNKGRLLQAATKKKRATTEKWQEKNDFVPRLRRRKGLEGDPRANRNGVITTNRESHQPTGLFLSDSKEGYHKI